MDLGSLGWTLPSGTPCGATGIYTASGPTASCLYPTTGTSDTFTVPSYVSSLTIDAVGGKGGSPNDASTGGFGESIVGTYAVTANDLLGVTVAGNGGTSSGGFAGGGAGGQAAYNGDGDGGGGGGGGATSVLDGTTSLLVAAGAGGGGWDTAGRAAGATPQPAGGGCRRRTPGRPVHLFALGARRPTRIPRAPAQASRSPTPMRAAGAARPRAAAVSRLARAAL